MSEFKEILLPIAELLEKKNTDYGDSYKKLRDKYGALSFYIRLADKMNRIEQVDKNGLRVDTESAIDTLKDIIGYATLELKYRLELSEKKKINSKLEPSKKKIEEPKKQCATCKWKKRKVEEQPCISCDEYCNWQPKTDKCRDCLNGQINGTIVKCNLSKQMELECKENRYRTYWHSKED